jgi:N-acetylneuraminic acid mutarotase
MRFILLVALACVLAGSPTALGGHVWTARAPLPEPVEGACTAAIGNAIYTAFGLSPATGDTNLLRVYDVDDDSWSLGPSAPSTGRSEAYRGVAHGGKLYCLGGRPLAPPNSFSFEPATGSWEILAPMPDPRVGTTAAAKGNDIYVFGGRQAGAPCSGPASGAIKRYDVDADAWFPAGNLVSARSDASAVRVGRFVYVFGGCDAQTFYDSVERYDTKSETSTLLFGAMPGGARANPAAARAGHSIHVTGGWRTGAQVTPNHLLFRKGSFTVGTEMPTHCPPGISRAEHELVRKGGRLFAVGGACPAFGTSLDEVDALKLRP